jgi:creatinine amidohydrolase
VFVTVPASDITVAVLPLGATEYHGPHLPLTTDALIVDGILDRARTLDQTATKVLRLPTVMVGASAEHADRPGTISVEPEELIAQIVAAGETLAQAGIKRMVLFNGHGGNVAAASIAALKLRTQFAMLVASAHWLDFGLPAQMKQPAPVMGDVHGGWIETSVLMHLSASHVTGNPGPADAVTPAPSLYPSGPIAWGWMTSDMVDGGWVGRPDLAQAALGAAMIDHAAESLLGLVQELAAARWDKTRR